MATNELLAAAERMKNPMVSYMQPHSDARAMAVRRDRKILADWAVQQLTAPQDVDVEAELLEILQECESGCDQPIVSYLFDRIRSLLRRGRADDGERTTWEWLVGQCGAVIEPRGKGYTADECTIGERIVFNRWDKDESMSAELSGGGEVVWKTRGDVRRLCAALGVPLKE